MNKSISKNKEYLKEKEDNLLTATTLFNKQYEEAQSYFKDQQKPVITHFKPNLKDYNIRYTVTDKELDTILKYNEGIKLLKMLKK